MPSISFPTVSKIKENVKKSFLPVVDVIQKQRIKHQIIMLNELKIESQLCWDPQTNLILGFCQEHGYWASMEFQSEDEVLLLLKAVKEGKIHLAGEATCLFSANIWVVQDTNLCTVSIASDGEARCGEAIIHLTFKKQLESTSSIYPLLKDCNLMNMEVGDDDITGDKDSKHVMKCYCNLERGFTVQGVHFKISKVKQHLLSHTTSTARVD
ncbi:hypothetical protein VNI00_016198 [Paramarasmius palmivorus]|uniref:Uncharacterized protein n=1 Tax=Paramarasmius palmivorus TaxID=297713 RepID=A0AAW0BEU2_9AGAR